MSKIKDKIIKDKEFAHKEDIFITDSKGYKYFDGDKHLHTFDGKPLIGTSTVMNVLAKPLTWWASGLACEKFGWINKGNQKKGWTPKEDRLQQAIKVRQEIELLEDEDYLNLLDEAYSAHSKKLDTSAKSGTDLHEKVELYIKRCLRVGKIIPEVNPDIQPFINWAMQNLKRFLWSEMNCYSNKYWLGGITDFGFVDNQGKYGIGDIKSSKEAYDSQFWQCAGYDIQISENGGFTKDGVKVFTLDKPIDYYVIFPFGMPKPEAQYNYDTQGCREAFLATLTIHKKLN